MPLKNGTLVDRVAPLSLTVYTTDYDNEPARASNGVKVEAEVAEGRRMHLASERGTGLLLLPHLPGCPCGFHADAGEPGRFDHRDGVSRCRGGEG